VSDEQARAVQKAVFLVDEGEVRNGRVVVAVPRGNFNQVREHCAAVSSGGDLRLAVL
jgi:hypothetical protein